ncbi:MAG: protein of unknown function transrane [Cypionkella sp.]|uniref:DMT family transporter n=1 Tax=Cypionkella sp. TaxID=2811411 RepID=UPI00261A3BA9|nr:EamA family transporter [Cypionkella sp.]MDB5657520.1 protein of unknown function transrane [Cypionkella sp.]
MLRVDRNMLSFLTLCAIWGTTWVGIKAGVDAVPPLVFASTRFMTAGFLLLMLARWRGERIRMEREDIPRLGLVSLFMISFCYGPLFWGMQYINSGTAAVLELALTPIALLCFALLLGEETWSGKRLFAVCLGAAGLMVLFGPDALQKTSTDAGTGALYYWGVLAVASSAFTYGLGAVLARPLLRHYPSLCMSGLTTLIGGGCLFLCALATENGAVTALSGHWGAAAWSGWLFLVLFGSLLGYTIYMRLLRDIGASRSGSYAFVSPIVAVLLGVLIFAETVRLLDFVGMLIMLGAAYLTLQEPASEPPERTPDGR